MCVYVMGGLGYCACACVYVCGGGAQSTVCVGGTVQSTVFMCVHLCICGGEFRALCVSVCVCGGEFQTLCVWGCGGGFMTVQH